MGLENIMFLVLGFLAAGLLAIAVTPAIVNRAVRLTRRRIEAATPMTLNEFRADKDKLRAEFAIATRRAELQRERLRDKIAAQAVLLDTSGSELAALRTERDDQFAAIRGLQGQLEEFKRRIDDLSRENGALSARLREAEHTYPAHSVGSELDSGVDLEARFDPETLSGHYDQDVEDLLMALGLERQRAELFRSQVRALVARLDAVQEETRAERRQQPAPLTPTRAPDLSNVTPLRPLADGIDLAQARIENAGSHLNALLDTDGIEDNRPLLAEELLQDDLSAVRERVEDVERRVRADYKTRRFQPEALRDELESIADEVSSIVYAADSETEDTGATLFDRIRKFAGDTFEPANADEAVPASAVTDRMAALRDLRMR